MGLYDREYIQNKAQERSYEQTQSKSSLGIFIKQTYQLFAASLLSGSAGAYVGIGVASIIQSMMWPMFFLYIGLYIGVMVAKKKAGLNLILLFSFTFVSGLLLGPILAHTLNMPSGANIVANSFMLTTAAFGGLSVFAMNTKRDFTTMGKMLFIILIVVFVAGLLNIFLQSTLFQLAISSVSAILFSAYVLYDTQNIIRGNYETPIEGAIQLYIDFLMIFIHLLQIFGILGSDE